MKNLDQLDRIRSEFNEFIPFVSQETGLTVEDSENLGFVEVAKRISNPATQEKYCQLASKLLEENIRALQTDNETEYTSEWAQSLLMWCTAREDRDQSSL
ncbi:MAG: hypothetical protein K8H84_08755 [Sulfuricella denitrificans]|nr:hypothetical protein [Sulfuricella denitrificans]